ncbi:MAG TPA: cytochrome P450, partial [Pseudonocardiaceae bacterium]|nr:cytochrome P450 [Pseudonocardiaceae bacterium]
MTPTNMVQRVSDTQGRPAWLVSGHERVRDLLADPRLSRSHPNPGHPARLTQPGWFGGPIPDPEGELADLYRMRKLLTPSLSARRVERLRPRVVVAVIDRGMLLLLTHAEQREALQRDPTLAASAVEEIFRFASPIERARATRCGGLTRYAAADVKVDGVTIRTGDTVMFAVQEANEDESVFPDPTRFDITREHIPHLSLSHGAHFCL